MSVSSKPRSSALGGRRAAARAGALLLRIFCVASAPAFSGVPPTNGGCGSYSSVSCVRFGHSSPRNRAETELRAQFYSWKDQIPGAALNVGVDTPRELDARIVGIFRWLFSFRCSQLGLLGLAPERC